jgi:hypothetical protein
LFYFDWSQIEFIPDVETAWKFFHDGFFQIVNKHAPFRRFSVKGQALKSLDQRKPAGPDLLDPCCLNLAADFIVEPFRYLFNLTLEFNEIPKIWKSAFVLPLLKGGDPTHLNNYRPISKLSPLVKILETIVSEQLREFLFTNSILSMYQSGFRKRHSTIIAAMKGLNDIAEATDKKQHCVSLFIDLS